MPAWDGAASVLIGILLAGVAGLLVWESRGLLIGEGIRPETARAIRSIALAQPGVPTLANAASRESARWLAAYDPGPQPFVHALQSVVVLEDVAMGTSEVTVPEWIRRSSAWAASSKLCQPAVSQSSGSNAMLHCNMRAHLT